MTKNFTVEDSFWNLFPEVSIGVVVAHNVDNHGTLPANLLVDANHKAQQFVPDEPIASNQVVADWREAYRKFKTKKGARSSIENLLKRAQKGKPVTSINPLVDLYNVVSLEHAIPCGGENIKAMSGDLKLTLAQGGESFLPLGEDEEDPALPGEVVYQDDTGIVCRCWNWRDGQRTMLTEETTDVFFALECVNPERVSELEAALKDLKTLLSEYMSVDAETAVLTKATPTIAIL